MNDKIENKKIPNVPHLRFNEFSGEWEKIELNKIADKVTKKNKNMAINETFTNSAEYGIISQKDFFDKSISNSENVDSYYVVAPNDFVYNPRISNLAPVGPINKNNLGRSGIMSPLYTVFTSKNIDSTYLYYYFKSTHWHYYMYNNGDNGARHDRFSISDKLFFKMLIPVPTKDEQSKIAAFLKLIDKRIETQMKIIEEYKSLIKGIKDYIFNHISRAEHFKFQNILQEYKMYNDNNYVQYTVGKRGIKQLEHKGEKYDISKHKIFHPNSCILGIGVDEIGVSVNTVGSCSPIYKTYLINNTIAITKYLYYFLNYYFVRYKNMITRKSTRRNFEIDHKALNKVSLQIPSRSYQEQVVLLIDSIVSKYEYELNLLSCFKSQKLFLLDNLFI